MAKDVSEEALGRLRELAQETRPSALVVLDEGSVVAQAGDVHRPIELMSVTKSIVSLVVGQLVDRGLLSLDRSVADFVPSWRGTPREAIRLLHLLEHTSGLDDRRTTEDIYAAGDFVAFAAEAPLKHPPGARFFYSNRASNLLAPIVEGACGMPMDAWAREHLFAPLGVTDVAWDRDRAGNVQAMAGLQMSATGLARVGEMVRCRGRHGGQRLVSEAWIEASTAVYRQAGFEGPRGLLWWLDPEFTELGFPPELFEQWSASGVPASFIDRFRPLEGRYFSTRPTGQSPFLAAVQKALIGREARLSDRHLEPFYRTTWKANRPEAHARRGPPRTISANGWGGQLLVIAPARRLVVARLREVRSAAEAHESVDFFAAINEHLLGVRPEAPALSPAQRLLFGAARGAFGLLRRLRGGA